ncbi:MAG: DegV family protein [Acidiferrobacterales bacterium]|nr:DegV family protein [Acidiferrobacterales bacterium]
MTTAIIVDAACDLPVDFCKNNDIHVIPLGVVFGDKNYFDSRDPETTRTFYNNYSHFRARDVYSLPPSVDVITEFLQNYIVKQYEQALLMCLSSKRSNIYKYAVRAGKETMDGIKASRKRENKLKVLRIMDTQTLFTGQALLAYEAHRFVNVIKHVDTKELYEVLRVMSANVQVYTVPNDLYYIRSRASLRGEKSIGTWSYAMGKSFDMKPIIMMRRDETERVGWGKGFNDAITRLFKMVAKAIDNGLMINAIMVSYAGNTREIMVLDSFRDLQDHAEKEGIRICLSMMSTAAGVNVGPGALSIAYCA